MNSDQALLDELNGDPIVELKSPDAPATPPPAEDPLELPPLIAPTKRAAADAKHSTSAGGKGYRVKVRGEYFAQSKDSNATIRKNYEAEFNLPDLEKALSVIVGKLLAPALRKKYPDYKAYRTHEIINTTPIGGAAPSNNIAYMNREALARYVKDNQVPLDAEDYVDVTHLRDAVIDFTLNPVGFEDREAAKQVERAELAALAAMNPGLDIETVPGF